LPIARSEACNLHSGSAPLRKHVANYQGSLRHRDCNSVAVIVRFCDQFMIRLMKPLVSISVRSISSDYKLLVHCIVCDDLANNASAINNRQSYAILVCVQYFCACLTLHRSLFHNPVHASHLKTLEDLEDEIQSDRKREGI